MDAGTQIMDGKRGAQILKEKVRERVKKLSQRGIEVGLVTILVGDDEASKIYVNMKNRDAEEVGIRSRQITLPASTTCEELLEIISDLNEDKTVHGLLVQMPLPKHIDSQKIIEALSPEKDVDCFHPFNVGRLYTGLETFAPCTPKGVMHLLSMNGVEIAGKRAVVIGRSNIVGKPMAFLLLKENATVTIAHSKTEELAKIVSEADILVAAVGKPSFVRGDWIKQGAVVVDVGVNRVNGKVTGDVHFEEALKKASKITPVPGGVGLMTRAVLMENTVLAAERITEKKNLSEIKR